MSAHARNRLDVHAYLCVDAAARNRQNGCVHRPCYGRLPPSAYLKTTDEVLRKFIERAPHNASKYRARWNHRTAKRLDAQGRSGSLHAVPGCGEWIDCRDLGMAFEHAGELPHGPGVKRQ